MCYTEKQYKALQKIALELLDKYKDAEEGVISEFSFDIARSRQNLETEIAAYKKRIMEELA